jgi:hypothetical protein
MTEQKLPTRDDLVSVLLVSRNAMNEALIMTPTQRKLLDKTLKNLIMEFDKISMPRNVKVQPKGLPFILHIDLAWVDDIYCEPELPDCTFKGLRNDQLVKSGLFSVRDAEAFYESLIHDYDFLDNLQMKDKTLKAAMKLYNADIKAFCKKAEQFGKLYFEDDQWFFDEFASNYYCFDVTKALKQMKRKVDRKLQRIADGY